MFLIGNRFAPEKPIDASDSAVLFCSILPWAPGEELGHSASGEHLVFVRDVGAGRCFVNCVIG